MPQWLEDRLVNATLRGGPSEMRSPAASLGIASFLGAALCAGFGIYFTVSGVDVAAGSVQFAGAAALALVGQLLRKTTKVVLVSTLLAAAVLLICAGHSLVRGGFVPAALVWTATIPIGVLTLGRVKRRVVWRWTSLIVIILLALYAVDVLKLVDQEVVLPTPVFSVLGFVIAVSVLITTYMKSYERLQAQKSELERRRVVGHKMESISQLAGGIAHDFNNLLTVIRTHADLVGQKGEIADHVIAIEQAIGRGERLTRQLLTIGGAGVSSAQVFSPARAVDSVEHSMRGQLPEGITLDCSTEDGVWALQMDPTELDQVLTNLADNAKDAMPAGGKLGIEVDNVIVRRERAPTDPELPPGRYVRFAVSDEGEGMAEDIADKVFDPFFSTKQEGAGLGLTSAYGIVSRAGGLLTATSTPGQGSSFSIYLPAAEASAEGAAPMRRRPLRSAGEVTVLLVEDEPEVREVTRIVLERAGFTVLPAENGREAVSICHKHSGPIDALLTDVVMPGMRGPEVADRVRKLRPDIRVTYMSGYADDERVQSEIEQNRGEFIRKPFRVQELLDLLSNVLELEDTG
jgi:signal transduction histidine kinase/ActR/RegA family two-component response regulator